MLYSTRQEQQQCLGGWDNSEPDTSTLQHKQEVVALHGRESRHMQKTNGEA